MSYLEQLNDNLKTKKGLRYLVSITNVYSLEYLFLFEVVDWLRCNAKRLDCVVK